MTSHNFTYDANKKNCFRYMFIKQQDNVQPVYGTNKMYFYLVVKFLNVIQMFIKFVVIMFGLYVIRKSFISQRNNKKTNS